MSMHWLFQCGIFTFLLRHIWLRPLSGTGYLRRMNYLSQGSSFYVLWHLVFCHVTDMSFWQIALNHVIITSNIIKCKWCNLKWLVQFKAICYFVSAVCYQFSYQGGIKILLIWLKIRSQKYNVVFPVTDIFFFLCVVWDMSQELYFRDSQTSYNRFMEVNGKNEILGSSRLSWTGSLISNLWGAVTNWLFWEILIRIYFENERKTQVKKTHNYCHFNFKGAIFQ